MKEKPALEIKWSWILLTAMVLIVDFAIVVFFSWLVLLKFYLSAWIIFAVLLLTGSKRIRMQEDQDGRKDS